LVILDFIFFLQNLFVKNGLLELNKFFRYRVKIRKKYEYEYPNGVRVFSQCRQINGCEGKVEEAVMGTKGYSNCAKWIISKDGNRWRFTGQEPNPYHQEHIDLIESIRNGNPINEAKNIAESTMTAIIGRESAYSGQTIEWDKAINSNTRLGPEKYEFGPLPVPPVPLPGKYKFI